MTGPKLNEKSYVVGERAGTKATAKYVRTSASKARVVLDLIRDLDVTTADQVLRFTERHVAHDIRKVLASAVANAVNNDDQDAEELFVIACFADEGPTLRRFRPRARGRASRINKRSCHITVIVARMSDERIDVIQARAERAGGTGGRGRPTSSAASRRARVERSRQKEAEDAGEDADDEVVVDAIIDDEPGSEAEITDESSAPAEGSASDEADAARGGSAADDEPAIENGSAADDEPAISAAEWPGSVQPPEDGGVPEGHEIKGNIQSMLFHEPGSRYYRATKAEVWFDSAESAEAAGFTKPGASKEAAKDDKNGPADDAAQETDVNTAAEGSASDEADASRGESEADDEGAV
jgi:large subunit ribosomal protein L22